MVMVEIAELLEIEAEVRELALNTLTDFGGKPFDRLALMGIPIKKDYCWHAATAGRWEGGPGRIRMNMTVLTTKKDYRDTLVHEFAHAITQYLYGSRHGHDRVWKKVARAMGDDGERCHTIKLAEKLPGRYTSYVCPCGRQFNLSYRVVAQLRRGQRRWCQKCKTSISLDKRPAAIAAESTQVTAAGYLVKCVKCNQEIPITGRRMGRMRRGQSYTHKGCGGLIQMGEKC